jgi:hypothetical protein
LIINWSLSQRERDGIVVKRMEKIIYFKNNLIYIIPPLPLGEGGAGLSDSGGEGFIIICPR